MQKEIIIKTTDKKKIFGTLDTPKGKSKGLIIFIHGLTGHRQEHIFFNAAKYFTKRGYNTYRFDLYGFCAPARILEEACLKTHAEDTNSVIKHFQKQGAKNIFVVGHSFGGLTILYSEVSKTSGVILRDSSFGDSLPKDVTYNKKTKQYILDRGTKYIIGKNMYDDFCTKEKEHIEKMKKITAPVKILCAGKGILKIGSKKYYETAKGPKDFIIIPGASHCFDEEGTEEKLFEETYKRVKRFSK